MRQINSNQQENAPLPLCENAAESSQDARGDVSGENRHQHSGEEPVNDYTAKNIRILRDDEAEDHIEWLRAGNLAAKYHKPVSFIERGIEAYCRAGSNAQAFEDRYLKKLPDAPRNPEAEAISVELQRLSRR